MEILEVAATVIGIAVSVATLVGAAIGLSGRERARRRTERAAAELKRAPAELRPAYERMHWEASVHHVALALSAASYGRGLGFAAFVGAISLTGVGLFGLIVFEETEAGVDIAVNWTSVFGACLFTLATMFAAGYAAGVEASRRHLYDHLFDRLIVRKEPDQDLLNEASHRDSGKRKMLVGVAFALFGAVFVGAAAANLALTIAHPAAQGIVAEIPGWLVAASGIVTGVLGAMFVFKPTRRPLQTLLSPPARP